MPQIALIATESIAEHGLSVRKGEAFETSPLIAAALTYQRKARLDTVGAAIARTAETVRQRTKRTYRRRDLTADQ